jgi:uncharacterized membrane protein YgcG
LAPPLREKKEEPEEEWEQSPPELLEETRPWWVEHRELPAALSRHPDDPADVPGQTLAVAHSLPVVSGAPKAVGVEQPVVDLVSADHKDIKPAVKKEGGVGSSSGVGGRYGGGRRGGGGGRYGDGGGIGY